MTSGNQFQAKTYLTFTLDDEDFAVDVAQVREVLDYTRVTRVPRTPGFMKGVINLRGSVVPVVDMRLKFGLPEAQRTVDTCIVVLEVQMEGESTVIGAIADSVKEVFELPFEEIEPPPRIGTRLDTEFISGMGKRDDSFIMILDVNRVFSVDEMEILRQGEELGAGALDEKREESEEEVEAGGVSETTGADPAEGEPEEEPAAKRGAPGGKAGRDKTQDSPKETAPGKKQGPGKS